MEKEFRHLINSISRENVSNTPDFILAQFLETVLIALETAIQQRESWYNRDSRPTLPGKELKELKGEK